MEERTFCLCSTLYNRMLSLGSWPVVNLGTSLAFCDKDQLTKLQHFYNVYHWADQTGLGFIGEEKSHLDCTYYIHIHIHQQNSNISENSIRDSDKM